MSTSEYLRLQAEHCLRIARSCFDLASAERMRLLATELRAKAAEIDDETPSRSYTGRNRSYPDRDNNNRQ
jgi:hypothetical protein